MSNIEISIFRDSFIRGLVSASIRQRLLDTTVAQSQSLALDQQNADSDRWQMPPVPCHHLHYPVGLQLTSPLPQLLKMTSLLLHHLLEPGRMKGSAGFVVDLTMANNAGSAQPKAQPAPS